MLTCSLCPERTFVSPVALHQHQSNAKGHFYCRTCGSAFADFDGLFDHAAVVHSSTCKSCRRMFASENGARRHFYDSPKHPKCQPCTMGFRDRAGLNAHKAEVHGIQTRSKKNGRRGRRKRPFSPTASDSERTSTPSSSLRLWSPSTSVTSQNSDSDIMTRMLSMTAQFGDGMTIRTASSPDLTGESHGTEADGCDEQPEKEQASPVSSTNTHGFQKTCKQDERLPSFTQGGTIARRPTAASLESHTESNELAQEQGSPVNGASTQVDAKMIFTSPLLRTGIALPTAVQSDSSSDSEDLSTSFRLTNRLSGRLAYRRSSPQPPQSSPRNEQGDGAMGPLQWGKSTSEASIHGGTGFVDAIRAACQARSNGMGRSPSPLRLSGLAGLKLAGPLPWLSQLPTIMDEQEIALGQDADDNELESMEEPIVEIRAELQDITRLAGRRKRRLSLSPTLPSIPEAVNTHEKGPASAAESCESDSDSSQGIYEHNGRDFLYDSLSETERCQTPMTYLTADDPDLQADKEGNFSYPPSPTLLVEDLTKLAEEICSSSTTEGDFYDPSADPFELHPSANNSPMSATFPKRPRAWSLSEVPYDPKFLSPSRSNRGSEHTELARKEERPDDVTGPGNEEPDEAAISADEPEPRAIEEDLFSETDGIMEPILPTIEQIAEPEEARFAEEGHPLRSLISLDTLPFTNKDPNPPDRDEHSFPSQTSSGDPTASGEHEAVPGRRPLRCRICQSDPCKDITATFCGHIFCHECITREVMEKSRCPVCNAPTLLYCLFKLDLGS